MPLRVVLNAVSGSLSASDSVTFTPPSSPLLVYIRGGNQQQSQTAALTVSGVAKDLDAATLQTAGITYTWTCNDVIRQVYCFDVANNTLTMPSNTLALSFPANTFNQYSVLQFVLAASKGGRSASASVIVTIQDTGVTLLSVQVPENIFLQKLNADQDIYAVITTTYNIADIQPSVALLYQANNSLIASQKYNATSFYF